MILGWGRFIPAIPVIPVIPVIPATPAIPAAPATLIPHLCCALDPSAIRGGVEFAAMSLTSNRATALRHAGTTQMRLVYELEQAPLRLRERSITL